MSVRSRRWCFTLNNPTEEESDKIYELVDLCIYLIIGDEVGESGTPHLQGYVVFSSAWTLTKVKRYAPRAHFEKARGTSEENKVYCGKEGSVVEYGVCPRDTRISSQQNVDMWDEAKNLAKLGKFEDIRSDIFIRYYSSLHKIYRDYQAAPACIDELLNEWYFGETGTGKSRKAFVENPGAYRKSANKWWDHYKDEQVVIIEEIDPVHECLGHHLKIWTDHYPFVAEIKGGSRLIRPGKFIVTSNFKIEDIFKKEIADPLKRRFRQILFLPMFAVQGGVV